MAYKIHNIIVLYILYSARSRFLIYAVADGVSDKKSFVSPGFPGLLPYLFHIEAACAESNAVLTSGLRDLSKSAGSYFTNVLMYGELLINHYFVVLAG